VDCAWREESRQRRAKQLDSEMEKSHAYER